MKNYCVIEGVHKDPNLIESILEEIQKKQGAFDQKEANQIAKGLIQKNTDDFYHRAWVIENN